MGMVFGLIPAGILAAASTAASVGSAVAAAAPTVLAVGSAIGTGVGIANSVSQMESSNRQTQLLEEELRRQAATDSGGGLTPMQYQQMIWDNTSWYDRQVSDIYKHTKNLVEAHKLVQRLQQSGRPQESAA